MKIQVFTFNEFLEHTIVVSAPDGKAVIIDPGCHRPDEVAMLTDYIESASLQVEHIYLTHAHIDHVFGLQYCIKRFGVGFSMHPNEDVVLDRAAEFAAMYGMPYDATSTKPHHIEDGASVQMGGMTWRTILAPGHSPGSLCYYQAETAQLIGGDVLFRGSIGRTDLPGGDHDTLIASIKHRLLVLPDETVVYPGHGDTTRIGLERATNPFLS